jgi:hypothetical protein
LAREVNDLNGRIARGLNNIAAVYRNKKRNTGTWRKTLGKPLKSTKKPGKNCGKVYNNTGQLISNEKVNSNFYQLNTSWFDAGIYFFQVESNEGGISKRILIH